VRAGIATRRQAGNARQLRGVDVVLRENMQLCRIRAISYTYYTTSAAFLRSSLRGLSGLLNSFFLFPSSPQKRVQERVAGVAR